MFIINSFLFIIAAAGMSIGLHRLRTGQTTSYRTGDDGDREEGRDTDFLTLAANNPFGNTNRFTDELGGQTYTLDIVIDWSTYDDATVYGIERNPQGTGTWATAIDGALAFTVTGFTSGWYLPNRRELDAFVDIEYTANKVMDYAPLSLTTTPLWSSSTYFGGTGSKWHLGSTGAWGVISETNTAKNYICMREFTVTGTTLT